MKDNLTKTFTDRQLSGLKRLGVPFAPDGKSVFYAGDKRKNYVLCFRSNEAY